jgi:hypothetical protein
MLLLRHVWRVLEGGINMQNRRNEYHTFHASATLSTPMTQSW